MVELFNRFFETMFDLETVVVALDDYSGSYDVVGVAVGAETAVVVVAGVADETVVAVGNFG